MVGDSRPKSVLAHESSSSSVSSNDDFNESEAAVETSIETDWIEDFRFLELVSRLGGYLDGWY
jgi:hypothetical protein